jgi:integrase/recombinase XerD
LSGFACPLSAYENTLHEHKLLGVTQLATAKALTAAEVQQVLDYTAKHNYAQRNRLMFLMTVAAGLRVSEVAGLTIGDVRNADGTVRGEVFLAANRVKHAHSRTIYINTRLQAELAEYIRERVWLDASQPLFYTHRGVRRAFSPNTLAQHFHYMYKRAGIKQGSSHSGRKTFLTSLASQGISVFVLASLAGHKSITTTQKYVTVNADMNRRAVELV